MHRCVPFSAIVSHLNIYNDDTKLHMCAGRRWSLVIIMARHQQIIMKYLSQWTIRWECWAEGTLMNSMAKNLFRAIFYQIFTNRAGPSFLRGNVITGNDILHWFEMYVGLGYLATTMVVTKSSEAPSPIHLCKFAKAFCGRSFFDEPKLRVHDHIQSAQLNMYDVRCSLPKTLEYIKSRSEQLRRMRIEYQFQTHLFFPTNKREQKDENGERTAAEKENATHNKTSIGHLVTRFFIVSSAFANVVRMLD